MTYRHMRKHIAPTLAACLWPCALASQAPDPRGFDSTEFFLPIADSVAATQGFPSLRSTSLPQGVEREIRAWVGFGLMYPQQGLRIRVGGTGVDGWLGLWWRGTRLPYRIASSSEVHAAEAERRHLESVEIIRNLAADRGCRDRRESPSYETCTMVVRAAAWSALIARLDELGISQLPREKDGFGNDGFTLLVEYRDKDGYRAYTYWSPTKNTADDNRRAAAAIVDAISELPH